LWSKLARAGHHLTWGPRQIFRHGDEHLSLYWNAAQNRNTKVASKLFENVTKFEYLEMTMKETKLHSQKN